MSKEYADRPIGVFDSGQGGLTVLSRLVDLMPNEDYVFYGDSANAPYGVKSKEEVYQLAKRVVVELIDNHQVKAVMIACNTATSAAVDRLRREYSLPIIGIEPAVKPASEENPGRQVVAMATPLTLEQDKFNQLVAECAEPGQVVKVPAPKLVELIEKGQTDSPAIYQYIQEILGPQAKVYDGAIGAAAEVKRQLASRDELNASSQPGQILFENSAPAGADLSKRLYALYRQKQ